MNQWQITTFYRFVPVADPAVLESQLMEKADSWGIKALIILGKEGINGTTSFPSAQQREDFKNWLRETLKVDFDFKDSSCEKQPFKKFSIKIRPEIVTLQRPDLVPTGPHRHLSPTAWEQAIAEGAILVDTRNAFESEIGTFAGAITPDIASFDEFPEAAKKMNLPKDKKVLIFCTGGIRCEKAILALEEQGHNNVYQLEGGILRYLEETDGKSWNGECFVFDDRVAVTKELKPSARYSLCPHCGDPGELAMSCAHCDAPTVICHRCADKGAKTCSKNCAYHEAHGHKRRQPAARSPKTSVRRFAPKKRTLASSLPKR